MQKIRFAILMIFLFVTLSLKALAAGGRADVSHMDWSFYFSVINFVLFVVILFCLLRKPILRFFKDRSHHTKNTMEEAKKFYESAYRKYEEIEAKLKNADQKGKQLLKELKNEGELEKENLVKKAKEMAELIKSDAEKTADQELLKAKEILKQQAAHLISEMAETELESRLTVEDQRRLGSEFLTKVQNQKRTSS